MRRVVVTGLGAVTPLGASLRATAAALARGEEPGPLPFDATGFASGRGAGVAEFDARAHFRLPKALKLCDRRTRFAVAAAAMAVEDAGYPAGRDGLAVLVGTSGSDLGAGEFARALGDEEPGRAATEIPFFARRILSGLNPLWLLVHLPNMASAHVAIQLEARGPNSTLMTGWAAGLQAIDEAAALIREGSADACVAGGADSPLHPFAYAGFEQAGLLEAGFVPGEGAAMLLLEEAGAAEARGARVFGEVLEGRSGASAAEFHPERDPLAARTGHLLAAHAPLRLALALLEAGDAEIRCETSGPLGEWAELSARRAAGAANLSDDRSAA